MTATPRPLYSLNDIKAAATAAGSHFFDRDTMRWFGSRASGRTIAAAGGARTYFVTSEQDQPTGWIDGSAAWEGERRYTVRVVAWADPSMIDEPTGSEGFGGYASRAEAIAAARDFAASDTGGALVWPCPIELHAKYGRPLELPTATVCHACAEAMTPEPPMPRKSDADIRATATEYLTRA